MEDFINACDPFAPTRFENITQIKIYGRNKENAPQTLILQNEYVYSALFENSQLRLILELQDGILDLKDKLETLEDIFITINCNSILNEYILMLENAEFIEMGYAFPTYAILTFLVEEDEPKISFNTSTDVVSYYRTVKP